MKHVNRKCRLDALSLELSSNGIHGILSSGDQTWCRSEWCIFKLTAELLLVRMLRY
jgi:hypothetical protein